MHGVIEQQLFFQLQGFFRDIFVERDDLCRDLLILRMPVDNGQDILDIRDRPFHKLQLQIAKRLTCIDFLPDREKSWQPQRLQPLQKGRDNTGILC